MYHHDFMTSLPALDWGDEEYAHFRIDLNVSLQGLREIDDAVTWYHGSVIATGETDREDYQVGLVQVFVLAEGDQSALKVLEADSATQIYSKLFDARTGKLRRSALDRLSSPKDRPTAILGIHEIALVPEARGFGLAHHVIDRIVRRLGRGCGMAVLKPYPLQFGSLGQDDEDPWAQRLELYKFGSNRFESKTKLAQHYGKVDFIEVPYTKLMIRDLTEPSSYVLKGLIRHDVESRREGEIA